MKGNYRYVIRAVKKDGADVTRTLRNRMAGQREATQARWAPRYVKVSVVVVSESTGRRL